MILLTTKKIKSYSELRRLETYEERFKYLKLNSSVGTETFGVDRYLNQRFYRSAEWRKIRDYVIVRDNGCDMGVKDHEIVGKIYIHHMNPLTMNDIEEGSDNLLNPEYLICVSHETHNAIHYGDDSILEKEKVTIRTKNDTCPWKRRSTT